jgi:alkylation response protein AidB-like acyl-CoA dehydrogenase
MRRPLTERRRDWRDRAVAPREQQLAPHARRIDAQAAFPRENLRAIREAGLFFVGVPQELGGAGADGVGTALVCEELARGSASTATVFAMHVNSRWPWAAPEQRRRYVEPGVRQGLLATHATTSGAPAPGSGTTCPTPRGRAWLTPLGGEGLRHLGGGGGRLLVFDPPGRRRGAGRGHPLLRGRGGWAATDEWRGLCLLGQRSARMVFTDVPVPEGAAVQPDGTPFTAGVKPTLEALSSTPVPPSWGWPRCWSAT